MNGHPASQPAVPVANITSVPMAAEGVPVGVPMAAEGVHMDTPYRLSGPVLPVNAENTKSEDPDRITGSDVPMDVHMDTPLVAGQRASPESAWPSEGTSNPAGAWRAVLGRLQLEMPRDHFNTFLQPCVGYAWEDGDLVVAAASAFVVEWLGVAVAPSDGRGSAGQNPGP